MLTLAQTHRWHWSAGGHWTQAGGRLQTSSSEPSERPGRPGGTFLDEFATVRLNLSGFGFHLVIRMTGFCSKLTMKRLNYICDFFYGIKSGINKHLTFRICYDP